MLSPRQIEAAIKKCTAETVLNDGSGSRDAGVDRFTRDLIQQHAMGDTGSRHYDRADYLGQMRDAMTKWSDWLSVCLQ